jgi:alpha-ketoglutarate-dependent taurine dioxygenase
MGLTIFLPLDVPESGGDTLYLSTTAAYNALSPSFRETLHGKYATHSGFSQAAVVDHRDRYIRDPIETIHPVIRTHPVGYFIRALMTTSDNPKVTKTNSLYVNKLYTRKIIGYKDEESCTMPHIQLLLLELMLTILTANILNFLYNHIEHGQDWHIRVHWSPGTVAVYDNRVTQQ